VIVDFIHEHADHREPGGLRWGVEPICAVLTEHGLRIAPSRYYERVGKSPTGRQRRDQMLLGHTRRVHTEDFGVYGARKVWLALNCEGIAVARCTVERLMAADGLAGAVRGKIQRTHDRRPGRRASSRPARAGLQPDRAGSAVGSGHDLRVDVEWLGVRRVRHRCLRPPDHRLAHRTSMTTQLVLDALEQAVWTRGRDGAEISSVVAHTDSKYVRCQVFPGFVTLTPIDPRGYRGVGDVLAAS